MARRRIASTAVAKSGPLLILMGKKSERVPKENIRSSNDEFFGAADAAPSPSIDTNGQEAVGTMVDVVRALNAYLKRVLNRDRQLRSGPNDSSSMRAPPLCDGVSACCRYRIIH